MSEMSKKARMAMRSKISRITKSDPRAKVDASDYTPPDSLDAGVKTGARPLSRRQFKKGGKVVALFGEMAKQHAGRKPRKSGGKAITANSYINRDVREANEEREGKKHIGAFKRGGMAKHEDEAQDKKLIRAELKKHAKSCRCGKCGGGSAMKRGGKAEGGELMASVDKPYDFRSTPEGQKAMESLKSDALKEMEAKERAQAANSAQMQAQSNAMRSGLANAGKKKGGSVKKRGGKADGGLNIPTGGSAPQSAPQQSFGDKAKGAGDKIGKYLPALGMLAGGMGAGPLAALMDKKRGGSIKKRSHKAGGGLDIPTGGSAPQAAPAAGQQGDGKGKKSNDFMKYALISQMLSSAGAGPNSLVPAYALSKMEENRGGRIKKRSGKNTGGSSSSASSRSSSSSSSSSSSRPSQAELDAIQAAKDKQMDANLQKGWDYWRTHRNSGGKAGMGKKMAGGSKAKGSDVADGKFQGTRPTGGRLARKHGGKAKLKGATIIKIDINGKDDQKGMGGLGAGMPPMPPRPIPVPPVGAGAPMPMPPAPPAGGMPPGGAMPPGMPPMGRKTGGRVGHRSYKKVQDMDAGSGSGLGRLEKIKIYGKKA